MYENFVKYISVCPIYHLVDPEPESSESTFNKDKLNKASFKDRCNILRETLQNVYQGLLNNDEAVAFHSDLIAAFYESLTFILLKRI